MKRSLSLAALVVVVAALLYGPATSSASDPPNAGILTWSEIAEKAISAGRPPASSSVLAAMVHGAIYDAVAAIEGGLEPFATDVPDNPDASVDAAVATAAWKVLITRVPTQAAVVGPLYTAYISGIANSDAKTAGIAVGLKAADGMIALRAGDGFDPVPAPTYVQPTPGPGVFQPIPPETVPAPTPIDLKLPGVKPFTYDSPSDYRPAAPYALTSKRYAQDVAELKMYGGLTGSARTQAQTDTALFFMAGTYAQYSRGMRALVFARGLDVRESARLLGYTWTAVADTMIACWEAKYHYMLWRPTNAIREQLRDGSPADDGNPATTPVPGWSPVGNGNHPEYPAGHGCFTAGVTTALHRYFGTKNVELTLTLDAAGNKPRTYQRLDDLVDEVGDARVWGGFHYRTTMRETARDFPRIARHVGAHHFLKGLESNR